jgi:hypothetical protein
MAMDILAVARDPEVDVILAASCGESLAEVAVRICYFDRAWLDGMTALARMELIEMLRHQAPELLAADD